MTWDTSGRAWGGEVGRIGRSVVGPDLGVHPGKEKLQAVKQKGQSKTGF